jgi:hypothetical protein
MDVRHYTTADEPDVRRIFRHTLSLGRPLPFTLSRMHAYERLCLGWFLGRGAEDGGLRSRPWPGAAIDASVEKSRGGGLGAGSPRRGRGNLTLGA